MDSSTSPISALKKFDRLTNYLSVAQIFLRDNYFLDRKLESEDIKARLLGHWGTCPGINYVYSNLNYLINSYESRKFAYIVGPGHGFPAFQSNLLVEGSLSNFYPEKIPYSREGFEEVISGFSTPYGYPSHLNPEAPGVILEGGELGYSLSVAGGIVLDNPDLVTVCLVGDGEAETGPLAASWNINKFLNPATDGAVLPILHLNGYKISGPTIFGRMTDEDIKKYFEGLGYNPLFIEAGEAESDEFYEQGLSIFAQAMTQILDAQNAAREGKDVGFVKWPMIVMRTPKGMGTLDEVNDKKIENNCFSHQIVFNSREDLADNPEHLERFEEWMKSYKIEELLWFDEDGTIHLDEEIEALLPEKERRIGILKDIYGGEMRKPLKMPEFASQFVEQVIGKQTGNNSMYESGKFLKEVMKKNDNLRLFSPDETYSNKLDAVFETTGRAWQLPTEAWDKDFAKDGKVIEILSEHTLFGMMWGYTLTGRHGMFATYEAFAQIIASMADQYVKFVKASRNAPFRKPVPSMNVVLSSLIERQDHNGFSHQNPSFIASSLDRDRDITNVYLPADKNLAVLAFQKSLESTNALNVIVVAKKMTRTWLTQEEALQQAEDEIMIWNKFSDEGEPDLVLVTAGDYVTEEALLGLRLFRERLPQVKVRMVNIFKLDALDEKGSRYTRDEILEEFLTKDKGILFNYHGYPTTIKKMLFDYNLGDRIIINGYEEEGSTTSPFDMEARNGLSRFDLVRDLSDLAFQFGLVELEKVEGIREEMSESLAAELAYIKVAKDDPVAIKKASL